MDHSRGNIDLGESYKCCYEAVLEYSVFYVSRLALEKNNVGIVEETVISETTEFICQKCVVTVICRSNSFFQYILTITAIIITAEN